MALSRRARAQLENPSKKAKTESSPKSIQVGDSLPDVEVTIQDETTVDLAKKYSKGILALFAYPKASTPGCTRQTSGFGEISEELRKLGAAVYGISADSPKAQTTFKNKTKVDFDLISDPSYELLGPLGAKKSPKGVIRSHWLFVNGKAVLVEHSVKPDESPKTILDAVKEYSSKPQGEDAPKEAKEEDDAEEKPEEESKAESAGADEKSTESNEQPQEEKEEAAEEPKSEADGDSNSEEPESKAEEIETKPEEKSDDAKPEIDESNPADAKSEENGESKDEGSVEPSENLQTEEVKADGDDKAEKSDSAADADTTTVE